MNLTPHNEALLRDGMRSENIQQQINAISGKIEVLEKQMAAKFNDGYLDVISKCAVLEQLQENALTMQEESRGLLGAVEDAHVRHCTLLEEHEALQDTMARLEEVKEELVRIQQFMALAASTGEVSTGDWVYASTRALLQMEGLKLSFKRYNFYKVLKECYEKTRRRVEEQLVDRAVGWIEAIDYEEIGRVVSLPSEVGVFDPLAGIRKKMMPVEILETAYAARRLRLEERIAGIIDERRRKALEKRLSAGKADTQQQKSSVLHFSVAFILLNHFLSETFPSSHPFYKETFEVIDKAESDDMETIIKLNKVVVALGLDTEGMDEMVEKTAFRYLEQTLAGEDFEDEAITFIDRTAEYLDQISGFTNELDDLFAKKIDTLLTGHLEGKASSSEFAQRQEEAEHVLGHLLAKAPTLASFEFSARDVIENSNRKYAREEYERLSARIKHAAGIDGAVEALLELRKFMNEACQAQVIRLLRANGKEIHVRRSKDEIAVFEDAIERNFPFIEK